MKELTGLFLLGLILLAFAGYIKNAYELANCDFESPYKCEVIHGIGIIPAIGPITGWIETGK